MWSCKALNHTHYSCGWSSAGAVWLVLGDAAWPEPPWVLHSLFFLICCGQMAEWLSVMLLQPMRSRVWFLLGPSFFNYYYYCWGYSLIINLIINIIWVSRRSPHGVHSESLVSPCGTVQGLLKKCLIYGEYIRSPWGVHVNSIQTPCRVHVDSM